MIYKKIKAIMEGLIETYGTKNLYELINCLGITVIKKQPAAGKKARFFRDFLGNEYIYIVPELDEIEEKYILAHELGHALMHGKISNEFYFSTNINKGKLEYEADCFAAELLISENPDDILYIENMSTNQLAAYYGVPEKLIRCKYHE